MAKRYVTTFSVTGRGQFPTDMLRYDQCYPHSSSDAAAIDQTGTRVVVLVHAGPSHAWAPTYERWASFLWSVEGVKTTAVAG